MLECVASVEVCCSGCCSGCCSVLLPGSESGGPNAGFALSFAVLGKRQTKCIVVCCSVLQCVAMCCSALQCVAVCCSVLQCVAVCCSVLQRVAAFDSQAQSPKGQMPGLPFLLLLLEKRKKKYVEVGCSPLECVAV